MRHVILVRNGGEIFSNNRLDHEYKGTWCFHNDIAKFNGSSRVTPKLDFNDPVAILYSVYIFMREFYFIYTLFKSELVQLEH